MVLGSLLDKIKQKGALFIEYAFVLAFVIVVGVMFISDGGIKNSIASIFGKANETLEVAVNGGEKQNVFANVSYDRNKKWNKEGSKDNATNSLSVGSLIPIKQGEYIVYFDTAKFKELTGTDGIVTNQLWLSFNGYDKDGNSVMYQGNAQNGSGILAQHTSGSDPVRVYNLSAKSDFNLGLNFNESVVADTIYNHEDKVNNQTLQNAFAQSITIVPKQ